VGVANPAVVDASADRARGCLLGLCVGGALGVAAAAGGRTRWELKGPTQAIGAPAAFALALAESWEARAQLDPADLALRWDQLLAQGVEPGTTTAAALIGVAAGAPVERAAAVAARLQPGRAGDGTMARALPLVLAAGGDRVLLRRLAYRSAAVTHADPVAAFAAVAVCLLGQDLGRHPLAEACRRTVQALREDLPDRALDALRPAPPGEAGGAGDDAVGVLAAVVAALAAPDLEDVVRVAAGHLAPASCGALAGGLAGLRQGATAIPPRWLAALDPGLRERCHRLAAALTQPPAPLEAVPAPGPLAGPAAPPDGGRAT